MRLQIGRAAHCVVLCATTPWFLWSESAQATTIYVNGDLWDGSPTGDGSVTDPFTSFQSAAGILVDGDAVLCAGRFGMENGVGALISDRAGFAIAQWEGMPEAVFDAGIPLEAEAFVAGQGGRYVIDVGPGRDVTGVTQDYGPLGGGDARFAGHLRRTASAGEVEAEAMSWFYDQASGQLHVHLLGGADPGAGGVQVDLLTATDGIRLSRCTDFLVEGLEFRRTSHNGSEGYGVNALSCERGLLRNIKVIDAGAHSLGFSGLVNNDNRIEECEFWGLQGGPAGQNHVVFFANDQSIRGGSCERSTFHLYGSLRPDGAPVDASRVIFGAFQHTGAIASIEPEGVVWKNCDFIGYDGHESRPWGGGPCKIAPPENPLDRDQHAIALIDCRAINCTGISVVGDYANVFFDRCVLDFSRRADAPAGARLGGIHTPIRIGHQTERSTPVFRACVIVGDVPGDAGTGALFALQARTDLALVLSTVHWRSANGSHAIIRPAATPAGALTLHSGVLFRDTPGGLLSGVMPAQEDITAPGPNWYAGVTTFAPSGSLVTESAWTQAIDPLGVYGVAPGFVDPSALDYTADPGSPARDVVWHDPSLASFRGVRRRQYDDHFGAVQYGMRACAADLDDSGGVDGADLAALLAQWGVGDEADVSGDGTVDGADLAALLASWGACDVER